MLLARDLLHTPRPPVASFRIYRSRERYVFSMPHACDRDSEVPGVLLHAAISIPCPTSPHPRNGEPIMTLHVSQPNSALAGLGIEPRPLVCNCKELKLQLQVPCLSLLCHTGSLCSFINIYSLGSSWSSHTKWCRDYSPIVCHVIIVYGFIIKSSYHWPSFSKRKHTDKPTAWRPLLCQDHSLFLIFLAVCNLLWNQISLSSFPLYLPTTLSYFEAWLYCDLIFSHLPFESEPLPNIIQNTGCKYLHSTAAIHIQVCSRDWRSKHLEKF